MLEIWKDIKGYEGIYQISNYGNIRSIDRIVKNGENSTRFIKGKNIKLTNNGSYYVVGLSKNSLWLYLETRTKGGIKCTI